MGRNTKRPDDYAPLLQFYLRAKQEGGKLLVPPELRARPDALARRECLVLVHGFNNTDSEAADAYFGFRIRQKEIFGTPMSQDSTGDSVIPIGLATPTGGPSSTKSTS
jgi:hypothetical protein